MQTAIASSIYTTTEESKVAIVTKSNAKVDSAMQLANPADFPTVGKWVGDLGFNCAETVLALWDALNERC